MTGRLIPTGSEAEWLEARRHGITASEISTVMGLSPASQNSPFALYHRKTGALPEIEDNDAMERGRILEPYIVGKFARRHLEFYVTGDGRSLYAHPDRPWEMATPDRIVYEFPEDAYQYPGVPPVDPLAVLETKTDAGGDDWGEEGTDDIPVHYRCQALWQMDVMGVGTAFVACLLIRPWKVRVYELTMDDAARADLKLMREEARDFLDRIDLGDPPDVDWRPPTAAALKHLYPSVEDRDAPISTQLAGRYMAACRNLAIARQKKSRYENQIRERIGSAHRAVDPGRGGQVIARRDVYPVKEHVRKATTVDKLVPVKAPKEPSE